MNNEYKMKQERRHFLNANETEKLTHEERSHGYHFCPDWDFIVVGPEDPEIEGCLCVDHLYKRNLGAYNRPFIFEA